jgi:hypothetical protein
MPQFMIAALAAGPDPDFWTRLSTLLVEADIPADPDWTYQKYTSVVGLANGLRRGQGVALATWSFRVARDYQREALRVFCPDLSAEVYVCTPTNETLAGEIEWVYARAIMNWLPVEEQKERNNATQNIDISFEIWEVIGTDTPSN